VKPSHTIEIRSVTSQDTSSILEIIDTVLAQTDPPDVIQYIKERTDWNTSVVAIDSTNGKIVGFYLLGEHPVSDVVDAETQVKEELSSYAPQQGVEGVALYVDPAYRGQGIASMLKDIPYTSGKDYVWGYQSKHLNNLPQWLKRRRLVAEDPQSYITLADIPKKTSRKKNWRTILNNLS
jgi:GNAT superfamily N-acetyltransferase